MLPEVDKKYEGTTYEEGETVTEPTENEVDPATIKDVRRIASEIVKKASSAGDTLSPEDVTFLKNLVTNFDSEVVSILENIGISRNEDDEIVIDAPVVFADGGNAFGGFDTDDFQFDEDNLVQIKNKGTKLYQHMLPIGNDEQSAVVFEIISLDGSPITSASVVEDCLVALRITYNNNNYVCDADNDELVKVIGGTGGVSLVDYIGTDTITPL